MRAGYRIWARPGPYGWGRSGRWSWLWCEGWWDVMNKDGGPARTGAKQGNPQGTDGSEPPRTVCKPWAAPERPMPLWQFAT